MDLPDVQYQRLLEFRIGLRQFNRWSTEQATEAGLTASQHQLLLAVRGHRGPRSPSIGELANSLVERPHSVSGLIDRAVAAGLVRRVIDVDDRRVVRIALTSRGKQKLERLTSLHLEELKRFGPALRAVWHGLVED